MECIKSQLPLYNDNFSFSYSFLPQEVIKVIKSILLAVRERLLHTARMSFLLASEDTGVFNVPVVIVPRYPQCTNSKQACFGHGGGRVVRALTFNSDKTS